MKKVITIILLCLYFNCSAQIVVEGNIVLYATNEPAKFAIVKIEESNTFIVGTETDDKGYFQIEVPQNIDTFSIVLVYFGFEKTIIPIVSNNIKKFKCEFVIGKFEDRDLYYTESDAIKDIESGKVQIYVYAHYNPNFIDIDTLNIVANKYGFRYVNLHAPFSELWVESVKRYNNTMEQYLEERNGKFWKKEFAEDLQKLQGN